MNSAAVIDLDRPPRARTAFADRPDPRRRSVALGLGLVAVMLLLGASVPARPGVTPVLTVTDPYDELLAPPYLYVGTAGKVVARPLVSGVRGWTATVPASDENPLNLALHGRSLVAGTTVLDADTGAVRLRATGASDRLVVGDGVAVVVSPQGATDRLTVSDLSTGRALWTQDGPSVPPVLLDGKGHLITVDPYGVATTRAVRDGRVLARADLGGGRATWDSADPANFAIAEVTGGHLYVRGSAAGVPYISEYDATTLTRRWWVRVPRQGPLLDCGADVCIAGDQYLSAWRVSDGFFRWIQPGWGQVSPTPDGRLLVADFEESSAALLDLADGHADRLITGGIVRGGLILHSDRDDIGRTWVIDLGTGQVRGRMTGVLPATCTAAGTYLACLAGSSSIAVWRVGGQSNVDR